MPDTLPNILLPVGRWTDAYTSLNIPIGTPVVLENVGSCDIYIAIQQPKPQLDHDAYTVIQRKNGLTLSVPVGASGLWAFCPNSDGKLGISIGEEFTLLDISSAILSELRMISCNQRLLITGQELLNLRTEEAFKTEITEADLS